MEKLNMKMGKWHAGEGQSLAEYGLILSLVAVVSVAGLNMLGNNISSQFNNIANAMSKATGGSSGLALVTPPSPGGGSPASASPSASPVTPSSSNPTTPTSIPSGTPQATTTPAPTQTPALTATTQTPASTTPQPVAVSDGQQGATLQCSGNDPSCAGNVDQGSTWGW